MIKQLLRSLYRDRLNTIVLIVSLAVGFASFNLIILFISRELGTDGFHSDSDRIYALKCDDPWVPGSKMYQCRNGSAEYMKENIAGVEDFCRIRNAGSQKIIVNNENYFDQPLIIGASSNFFSFFSYKLLTDNPETVLESKNNIVISEDLAIKYFGSDDPAGQVIELVNRDRNEIMVVSGVFKKPAENTQILFDMVRLTGEEDSRCYIKLTKNANPVEVEKLFSENKKIIPVINDGKPAQYYLEPFRKTYFSTGRGMTIEASRDKTDLLIALIIALMIIGVASFNYLGILTNKYLGKIKEYQVRRINGSSLISLLKRFMLENSVVITLSLLLSLFLMQEILPFFNQLTNSNITEAFIFGAGQVFIILAVVLFIFIITLFFAFYLLFRNLNLQILKAWQNPPVRSKQIPAFNIFQIASSTALIICSMVIIRQMNFITDKPIGIDKDAIEIKIPGEFKEKAGIFRDELMKSSSVVNVSVVGASPVLEHFLVSLYYQEGGIEKQYVPAGFSGDENYLDVLDIKLIAGTGFNENVSVNTNKCIVNESFAKFFSDRDLIGKGMPGMENMIITGIVNDFNYSGLKSYVEPAFISFDNKGSHLLVKPRQGMSSGTRELIASVWKDLIPDYPVNIESVGDRFEWFHRNNKNYIRLIGSCSLISLFLSMIGLFSISYQKARSRTKEIGIRKINGASLTELLFMINKDFFRWIIISFLIAWPLSWYAMNRWLDNYAYKADIGWLIFLFSAIIVLTVTLLTVSWQSWKAATRNPVEALRYE